MCKRIGFLPPLVFHNFSSNTHRNMQEKYKMAIAPPKTIFKIFRKLVLDIHMRKVLKMWVERRGYNRQYIDTNIRYTYPAELR